MTDTKSPDVARMMLMQAGAQFTMAMARKGLTPEEVSEAGQNFIPLDEMLKLMAGTDTNITIAKLVFLATQLDLKFMFGTVPVGPVSMAMAPTGVTAPGMPAEAAPAAS